MGYAKAILVEEQQWYYLTYNWGNNNLGFGIKEATEIKGKEILVNISC